MTELQKTAISKAFTPITNDQACVFFSVSEETAIKWSSRTSALKNTRPVRLIEKPIVLRSVSFRFPRISDSNETAPVNAMTIPAKIERVVREEEEILSILFFNSAEAASLLFFCSAETSSILFCSSAAGQRCVPVELPSR